MRRNTMTPARSRLSIAPSMNSSLLSSKRNVRDQHYQMEGVSLINDYITRNESNLNLLEVGKCPSYKEFQSLFKMIVSFFYRNLEIKAFQEEAFTLIRSLKYPFASELNKSHLITTNPHSWPVILAFLRWVVEMINFVEEYENQTQEDTNLLLNGYLKFMEGQDTYLEDNLKKKIESENEHILREINIKNEEKDNLNKEIEELQKRSDGPIMLQTKMKDLLEDKKSIQNNSISLETKKKKYLEAISQINQEILEIDISLKQNEKASLKKTISEQKINISDVLEMSSRKKNLLEELEKIKKSKENTFKYLNEIERDLNDQNDVIDKLENDYFNLMSDKENIDLSNLSLSEVDYKENEYGLHKDQNLNSEFRRNLSENKKLLERENFFENKRLSENKNLKNYANQNQKLTHMIDTLNNKISSLEESISMSKEAHSEYIMSIQTIKNELAMKQKRIFNLSKLYLEKKELHDLEKKKSSHEMNKLENELMNLSVESGNSLLHSEQVLQYNSIKKEKIIGDITIEENEIKLIISKFYNQMMNELDHSQEITENE